MPPSEKYQRTAKRIRDNNTVKQPVEDLLRNNMATSLARCWNTRGLRASRIRTRLAECISVSPEIPERR